MRDIELAFGRAEPLPGESVPTEDGVLQAVVAAIGESPAARQRQMQAGFDAAQGLALRSSSRLGRPRAPT